ncbi:hypothetical protein RMATCC62417_12343 [Rhizopus microsporus]|nr:hypothetical protein RMATCC62417_12343 [Rhizopus microsporus]
MRLAGSNDAVSLSKVLYTLETIKKGSATSYYTDKQLERTREHYCLAAADDDYRRSKAIPNIPEFGNVLHACDLSYSHRNTEALLELKAFDPSKDTPAEALHGVLLGIGKYLVKNSVQVVLKGNKTGKLKKLAHCIKSFKNKQAYHNAAVKTLIESFHNYDTSCRIEGHNPYCPNLKAQSFGSFDRGYKKIWSCLEL